MSYEDIATAEYIRDRVSDGWTIEEAADDLSIPVGTARRLFPRPPFRRAKAPAEGLAGNPEAELRTLIIANIMHLVDLKRAGHTAQATERRIPSEGNLTFYPRQGSAHFTSTAGLCAER